MLIVVASTIGLVCGSPPSGFTAVGVTRSAGPPRTSSGMHVSTAIGRPPGTAFVGRLKLTTPPRERGLRMSSG